MALDVVLSVVGLGVLLAGSNWLVAGGSRLASRRGISPVIVGAVILGFGTSMPEMVVGVTAAAQGDPALGLGGIVGSNAANMGLVLGVAALAAPITADRSAWRRVPAAVIAVGLFGGLMLSGATVTRWEGGVLLAAMVAAGWWLMREQATAGDGPRAQGNGQDGAGQGEAPVPAFDAMIDSMVRRVAPRSRGEMWRMLLGLAGIVAGAQISVDGFSGIAERLGIATGVVGLSLVAIGTSLPELATALVGIRRRQPLLTLGNLLGSNIFNSLAIGGIVAIVRPGGLGDGTPWIAIGVMMGLTLLAVLFLASGRRLERREGAVLLVAYAVALPLILLS